MQTSWDALSPYPEAAVQDSCSGSRSPDIRIGSDILFLLVVMMSVTRDAQISGDAMTIVMLMRTTQVRSRCCTHQLGRD